MTERSSFGRLLVVALPLAIVAGLAAWFGTEVAYEQAKQDLREGPFNPSFEDNKPPGYDQMGGYEQRDAIVEFELATKPPAEVKNAALANGLLGGLLGAALGLAGGLARRSAGAGANAAAMGLVAGAVAGVAGSVVMGPIYFQLLTPESGLELTLMTHGVIWALIGLAGGLALGLGIGSRKQLVTALVGGMIGGVVGTFVFEVVNAIVFPQVRVYEPVPAEWGPRLAAALCVAICVALAAVLSLHERSPNAKPAPAAD
ncbi:hypothetical protein [Tautonia marina]|uniref:hypothetical protein n=1 Tax=Tautonia marina TaxID=2653855 RepID=UPI0012613641|nr:hypothetical protein [Tautonia marina]